MLSVALLAWCPLALARAGPRLAWGPPGTVSAAGFLALACPSASFCVGVNGAGGVISSRHPDRGRRSWSVADVDGHDHISSVSCPTLALCVAVDWEGNVLTSIDPAGGSGAWRVAHVDSTSNARTRSSPGSRVSRVLRRASASRLTTMAMSSNSTNPTGGAGAWKLVHVDDGISYECSHYGEVGADCQPMLEAVSCPSTIVCVAIDDAGNEAVSHDPADDPSSWTGFDTGAATDTPSVALTCPAVSMCLAVDGSGGDVLTSNPSGPTLRRASTAYFGTAAALDGVWCPSVTRCFIENQATGLLVSANPTAGSAAWKLTDIPMTGLVTGVACPSAAYCVAVDNSGAISVGQVLPSDGRIQRQLRARLAPTANATRISRLLGHDGCRIVLDAPSAGLLKISWEHPSSNGRHPGSPTLVAAGQARSTGRGTITVELRLTRAGVTLLKRAARIDLVATGTFTPAGNPPINAHRTLSLHH